MFGQQSTPLEERGREAGQETQQYPRKTEEQFDRSKQETFSQTRARRQQQQPLPGRPRIGVLIAGFPSPFAKELSEECTKQGMFVSDIGLGCSNTSSGSDKRQQQQQQQQRGGEQQTEEGRQQQQISLSDGTKIDVLDCDATETRGSINNARDALEKEGAEVVIVLDVTQDFNSIELYNQLKLPFIHAGSSELMDENKMYEKTHAAQNAAVISPFISREGAMLQLNFEHFSRMHQGLFRDWYLDSSHHLAENNAVAAGNRRMTNALSYLVDRDPSSFSSLTSGKGTLSGSDEKSSQQQQPQQQEGTGMLAKLGLSSAATTVKETVKQTAADTIGCSASWTLRSPDSKHSFTLGHEHYGLADMCAVVQMAEFLADKIVNKREPRVWGLKDWVYGTDDLNRKIAEACECDQQQHLQQQQQQRGGQQRGGRRRRPIEPSTIQHQQERQERYGGQQAQAGETQSQQQQPSMGERMAERVGLGGHHQQQQQQQQQAQP
jgi:hypothetical protein